MNRACAYVRIVNRWSEPPEQRSLECPDPFFVTTEYRGVFFGYADDTSGDVITLTNARNCIYWPSANGGFVCDDFLRGGADHSQPARVVGGSRRAEFS